jgi:ankyrin repeat protein
VLSQDLKKLNGTGLRELQSSNASEREEALKLIRDNERPLEDCSILTIDELKQLNNEREQGKNRAKNLRTQLGINNDSRTPFWKLNHLESLVSVLERVKAENAAELKYFPELEFSLSKSKASTIKPDDFGYTEVHQAVLVNDAQKVEELLTKIGVNSQYKQKLLMSVDMQGQTALHWAAGKGFVDIATILINNMDLQGICMCAEGNNNYTALHFSVHSRSTQIVRCLINKFTDTNNTNAEACQQFVDMVDSFGQTALHWAAHSGQKDVVDLLVHKMSDKGMMQQDKNWKNYSALHLAVLSGNKEIVSLIYNKCNALVNLKDKDGNTPQIPIPSGTINYQEAVHSIEPTGSLGGPTGLTGQSGIEFIGSSFGPTGPSGPTGPYRRR